LVTSVTSIQKPSKATSCTGLSSGAPFSEPIQNFPGGIQAMPLVQLTAAAGELVAVGTEGSMRYRCLRLVMMKIPISPATTPSVMSRTPMPTYQPMSLGGLEPDCGSGDGGMEAIGRLLSLTLGQRHEPASRERLEG
jgi:hypothetical protein